MKLVLEKAENFQRSINAICALIDEAEFVVDEKGLALKAADPSKITIVDFFIGKKAFKEFDVTESTKMGVNIDDLRQIMSRAKPTDELVLEVASDKVELNITFNGNSIRKFSMALLDLSKETEELPSISINETATVTLCASVLQDGLKDALLMNSNVLIGISNNKFLLQTKGIKGNFNLVMEKDGKEIVGLEATEDGLSKFPIDYLQDILRGTQGVTLVKLKMKTDSPAEISYDIGPAKLNYFIAPLLPEA